MTNKKDIKNIIKKEELHLNNLLEPNDLLSFKSMTEELKDTWNKRQIFRTETEARFSVLQDNNHPTNGAKYWQCVKEQSVFLENLMTLSFEYRKNEIKTQQLNIKIEKEKDPLKKQLLEVDLDEKVYEKASMELTAKDRMRELQMWSKLKKEFNDGSFSDTSVSQHQLESYHKVYLAKFGTITPGTSQAEVHNIKGQLDTIERVKKSGELKVELKHDKKEELTFGNKEI